MPDRVPWRVPELLYHRRGRDLFRFRHTPSIGLRANLIYQMIPFDRGARLALDRTTIWQIPLFWRLRAAKIIAKAAAARTAQKSGHDG